MRRGREGEEREGGREASLGWEGFLLTCSLVSP